MDRLQAMSVFVAVAEESGFAAAARRLNMSPPTVTRAISDLEFRLDTRLLHRSTRTVKLTEAGKHFVVDCRRLLGEVEDAEQNAAGIHATPSGLVSVTASVPFGRRVLAPVLLEILHRYPEISVSLVLVDRIAHLLDEGIDIAVRIGELPDSSLTAIRVGTVRRVLCASPDYLAKHGRPVSPSELAAHTVINNLSMVAESEWTFFGSDGAESYRPASRLQVNKADAAVDAASAGYGITRVYSHMIARELESGGLETVLEDYEPPPVPIHVVHKETGQNSARVRVVVDHLVTSLRSHSALV